MGEGAGVDDILGGLGSEVGGVFSEADHHSVGTKIKGLPNFVQGEVAALDAVFSRQDLAEQVAGFLRQGGEGGIHLQGLEHLGLGEGAFWDGEAEGVEIHGEVKIKIKIKIKD